MFNLGKIRTDGGTQSRAAISEETVADYVEAMSDPNTVFPPVIVYYDGEDYWLADGFHRVAAWGRIGRDGVPADVRQGDRRQAILHSVAANAVHGLRRTNADKRRAVTTLLEDDEWAQWSNREIARRCGVSDLLVADVRRMLTANSCSDKPTNYTTKHGTTAQMDTSRIGKTKPVATSSHDDQQVAFSVDATKNGPEAKSTTTPSKLAPSQDAELTGSLGPNATAREAVAKLTREALEEDLLGLLEENAELQDQLKQHKKEIDDLNNWIKPLAASDQGALITGLRKQLDAVIMERDDAKRATKSMEFRLNKAIAARNAAERKLGAEVIKL